VGGYLCHVSLGEPVSIADMSISAFDDANDAIYLCILRGGNNHSPTRLMRVKFGIGE
jgi:hypothetical protein